ncbi:hypothetical protein SAMN02746062_01919 [Alysiella filiformis DSM 16848]|uniref:Uncharacterized protein n=2 Tax=Alysiella TaxID=194195 RepID=A0A286EGD1_9NEIS|nr:hypothetical protein SAMN02746062_01919 [Alysiella filiformis DSM 16848]
MQSITASDIAEFQNIARSASAVSRASDVSLPPLPSACSQYYQRVEQCFAKQSDHEGLLSLNEELKNDLVLQANADEQSCRILNDSFNGVARHLGCD